MTIQMTGKLIRIRPFTQKDIEPFRQWQQPNHKWQALDGPYYGPVKPEQLEKMIAKIKEVIEKQPPNQRQWVIADLEDDALLGTVTWYWTSQETNWLSVGIVLFDDAHWGRGIGYEALGLWSQQLLNTMPELVRLDLRTWSGNIGMMKLAEKLGYKEEARFRMARIVNGRYYDGMGYGILRSEWEERYPSGFEQFIRSEK